MTFKTVEQLQAQIASLTGENERLRALVKFAYFEGFEDGDIWQKAAEWWPTTETRAALQPKEGWVIWKTFLLGLD